MNSAERQAAADRLLSPPVAENTPSKPLRFPFSPFCQAGGVACAIVGPEGLGAGGVEEGHPFEPRIQQLQEGRSFLGGLDPFDLFGSQLREIVSLTEPLAVTKAQPGFQQLELNALKARGRPQQVAEILEVHRGHGLHDIDLVDQHLQDGRAAGKPVDDGLEFGGIVVSVGWPKMAITESAS